MLVVVPAALRDSTWVPFLRRFNLYSNRVQVVTYDDLRIGTKPEVQNLDSYALVVIDEAHNLRNTATQRAEAVKELLGGESPRRSISSRRHDRWNNSLFDLLCSRCCRISCATTRSSHRSAFPRSPGISNMPPTWTPMRWRPEHPVRPHETTVAVRRTRRFIKDNYSVATISWVPPAHRMRDGVSRRRGWRRIDYDLTRRDEAARRSDPSP